jgi:hypothetical protein
VEGQTCAAPAGNLNVMEHATADGGDFLSDEVLATLESQYD